MNARPPTSREGRSRDPAHAGSGALGRREGPLSGSLDRDPNIYGIRAVESCRARHCNLFGQCERESVGVCRRSEPDGHDAPSCDGDPIVDGVEHAAFSAGTSAPSTSLTTPGATPRPVRARSRRRSCARGSPWRPGARATARGRPRPRAGRRHAPARGRGSGDRCELDQSRPDAAPSRGSRRRRPWSRRRARRRSSGRPGVDGADVPGGGNRESVWIGPARRHAPKACGRGAEVSTWPIWPGPPV